MTKRNEAILFFEQAKLMETDSCIEWPFSRVNGYGDIKNRGYAHRLMCAWKHGSPPLRLVAAHSCGNKACINHRHLRWATRDENEADKIIHGTASRGERQGLAKLTEKKVLEIRDLLSNGETLLGIAKKYNVSQGAIFMIKHKKNWGWL